MFLFRLFLFFLLGLLIRRLWITARRLRHATRPGAGTTGRRTGADDRRARRPAGARDGRSPDPHSRITEQEIDDADFEEIP